MYLVGSKFSVLNSVGVFVLGLSFLMTSNAVVAGEQVVAIPLSSYEKLLERLDKLEAELAELKDEKTKQDSMVEAELAELKDEREKQDSMVEAELAELKDERKKQEEDTTGSRGYYATAELLSLIPISSRSTAFVVEDTGTLGASETSFTDDFKGEFGPGGRYEIGYMPQYGLGWAARYWHFNQVQKVNRRNGDFEANFFDDPDIAVSTGTGDMLARREFGLQTADLAATFVTRLGRSTLQYSAGVRGLDSNMEGYWTTGNVSSRVNVDNDWIGAGPLLGLDFTYPLYRNSSVLVNAYAGASGAMLFGNGELRAHDLSTTGNFVNIDRDNIVYSADLRFGLEGIMRPSSKSPVEFFGKFGAEAQHWINIGTVAASVGASGDSDDADFMIDGDLDLVGFTAVIGVRSEFD